MFDPANDKIIVTVDGHVIHYGQPLDFDIVCQFNVDWTYTGSKQIVITVIQGCLRLEQTVTRIIRPCGLPDIIKSPSRLQDPKTEVYIDGINVTPATSDREKYNAWGEWCYNVEPGSTIKFTLDITC
jgi:hypothetical protein